MLLIENRTFICIFTLLLYKCVFYRSCSIVEIHLLVYQYFARNSVLFIGNILVVQENLDSLNLFDTLLAALEICDMRKEKYVSRLWGAVASCSMRGSCWLQQCRVGG